MSMGKGGSKTNNNQASSVDAQTQAWMKSIMDAAQKAGAAGPSPLVTGAADWNKGAMAAGQNGMNALGGDAGATASLMNPYQSQVIGGVNSQWDQNDQHTMNAVNDRATQAGAFGGTRHGVATGTALSANNLNRNNQVGGLLYGGFNDAMGRAGQLAGMGANASAANANLGMGGVGSPEQWMFQMLKGGFLGPTGHSTSGGSSTVSGGASFKLPFLG